MIKQHTEMEARLLEILAHIHVAVGDREATLMPDELIDRCRRMERECVYLADMIEQANSVGSHEATQLADVREGEALRQDAERMRWLLSGHGYFMEERGLCGRGPCDQDEQDRARRQIDEAMKP